MKSIGGYKPSLTSLMNLCEVNYMMLLRLIADKESVGEVRRFFISDFLAYSISINEVTRYTTLITIKQEGHMLDTVFSSLLAPRMSIRLYHDARMAEVISNQDIHQVKPRYDYPNHQMHLPDEKQQINQFLKEWLQLSLQLGQSEILAA